MNRADRFNLGLGFALIALMVLARLLPHAPNVTPVAAAALFAGSYLTKRWAWLLPLVGMLVSDALIGWYELPVMAAVYASFVAVALLGTRLTHRMVGPVLGASVAGSLLFFLVTNAAVWAWGHLYPLTADGLVASYVNALPFFRNTLVGDVGYTALLFGAYELVVRVVETRRLTNSVGLK